MSEISLRPISRHDLDDFLVWATDQDVNTFMAWEVYTSKEDAENFLIGVAEKHPWFQAIYYEGHVIGSVTLDRGRGNSSCRAILGYVIAKQYWGQGLGTKMIQEATRLGFKDLKVKRIEAFVDPDNIASYKALEKAGFTREGLLKKYTLEKERIQDRYIYSFISS